MSDSPVQSWSDNPNAPKIPYSAYFAEKATFAGALLGSILYGIVIMLFFQCMAALLNPIHRRREGIKWGLVAYIVAMFSFVTVHTGLKLNIQSISFIDNREFAKSDGTLLGPIGYQKFILSDVLNALSTLMFFVNHWLADSHLLYRCYVVYSMNLWVIAFPSLMCLACAVLGLMVLVGQTRGQRYHWTMSDYGYRCLPIAVLFNVLLTLMIAVRLVLYNRNIRSAMGNPGRISGLYRTTITILIESSALYAVSSLLVIGSAGAGSPSMNIFIPILAGAQVIAPLLIIQRVANQSALTSRTIVTGRASFGSLGESTSGTLPCGYPRSSANKHEKDPGEGIWVESTIDITRDKV